MLSFINRLLEKLNVSGRDAGVFLVSLLLAFSLWLSHSLNLEYSVIAEVPVIADSNIEGHSATSVGEETVAARCRASGFRVVKLKKAASKKPVRVKFAASDLHWVEDDIYSISSNGLAGYVSEIFGEGVRLESFISQSVKFRFPEENCKKVPVQAVRTLSFKSQYMAVGDIQMDPDSVMVYGEPTRLANIDRVYTAPLRLTNLNNNVHGEVRLEPMQGLRYSANSAVYTLEVSRYVELTSEVKILTRNVPFGKEISVFPSVATVSYRCAFPLSSNPLDCAVLYIDYNDFQASLNGRCVPKAEGLPSSVIEYKVEPEVFECVESVAGK